MEVGNWKQSFLEIELELTFRLWNATRQEVKPHDEKFPSSQIDILWSRTRIRKAATNKKKPTPLHEESS